MKKRIFKKYLYHGSLSVTLVGAGGIVAKLMQEVWCTGDMDWFTFTSFALFFTGIFTLLMYHVWKEE